MRHIVIALAGLLAGCDAQYRALTAEYRETYAATAEEQLVINLARAAANPRAIPNQLQLGNSQATVQGRGSISANPAVAFRAIAVTGVGLGAEATMTQQMTITPVNNHLALRQLQLLFAYALPDQAGRCAQATRRSDDLEAALWTVSFPVARYPRPPGLPLSTVLGPLPDGCLVAVEPGETCARNNPTRVTIEGRTICFRDGLTRRVNGIDETLSAGALRSLLALWTIAIPLVDDEAMAEFAKEFARQAAAARRPGRPGAPAAAPAPAPALAPQQAPVSQRRLTPPSVFVVPSAPR
ncbi:hypothetical protein [Roseomonas sp. CECT 9278]|uniref:hypothetical protein n=1 Tax=Roseomonas sp. CECT 9278 TaxID=2845823 RepID=UPI001E35AE23|nr:hypothetical protein [Roseomonas sp. CECT 9278]CAH0302445.1 hypothetical protein ROS9278_04601 [Roseomonas sp. CECT 9278]